MNSVRRLENWKRLARLVDQAIAAFELDLTGLHVLTEAASGSFIATCLSAARAGAAGVVAVTRDSRFGAAAEVIDYGRALARAWGMAERIKFSTAPPESHAAASDIVTNLGFVRPIHAGFVASLPATAVIALMWEPWELRPGDIDLAACRARGIPVIGTRETDPRLGTFHYVGMQVVKLLFEQGLEIRANRIGVLASNPFGSAIVGSLTALGATVMRFELPADGTSLDASFGPAVEGLDALIVAEHRDPRLLIGEPGGIAPVRFAEDVRLVHVCGNVDSAALAAVGVGKHPAQEVSFGYMTVATDYVGPKPVVDLHTAGLKVGEVAARARRAGANTREAIRAAERTGLGLRIPEHAFPAAGVQPTE